MTCIVHDGITFVQRFIQVFARLTKDDEWAKTTSINPSTYGFYVSSKGNVANVVIEVLDGKITVYPRVNNPKHDCSTYPLPNTFTDEYAVTQYVYNFIKENH